MPESPCTQPPYQDLHIYYLKGCVRHDPAMEDQSFIGNWQEEEDAFLFFSRAAGNLVQGIVARQPGLMLIDQYEMTYEQWQGGRLTPFRAGRLEVVPPWHEKACSPHGGTILLDPGVVFGTGTHPTTLDCLEALQTAFDRQDMDRVLDLGTGTGLLALAAARLGAGKVVAVDLNALATVTALRNVRLNALDDTVLVVRGDAKNFMDLPCDLMVSNMHYDVMRYLVDAPGFKGRKQFILSGLLRSQARDIEHRLSQGPAKILHKWDRSGIWTTFYGEHA